MEEGGLNGLDFQHASLCTRRAWLHMHRVDYSHLDERMAYGTALHEISRPRDKSTRGLFGLAPDRIDWKNRLVVEAKGRGGAEEAVGRQTAFYALLLWVATGRRWKAGNEILETRRKREVPVNDGTVEDMIEVAEELIEIRKERIAPPARRKGLCKKCSYRRLCWGTA